MSVGAAPVFQHRTAGLSGSLMTIEAGTLMTNETARPIDSGESLPASVSSQEALARAERLLTERRVREALALFQEPSLDAVYPGPCAGGRWQCHMLLGDLDRAWTESDTLRRRGSPDPHRFWNGSALEGRRVILRCLHGLGDTIQFLRYLPQLASITAQLILEVPPALLDLAPSIVGPDEVITWGEHAPTVPPAWDLQIEIMEVPYLLRSNLNQLPAPGAGFRLPGIAPASSKLPGNSPRVGIVWTGGVWNPSRSLPFPLLGPLFSLSPEISFFSLQPSATNLEWDAHAQHHGLHGRGTSLDSILPLVNFIAGLDLIITVDTLAAHLAGALGRPTWVLLQHEADWRWMLSREDTPWYPTARLFRQSRPGDWAGLIDRVRKELEIWSNGVRSAEVSHASLG